MNAKTLILAILINHEATGYEIRKKCSDGPYSYFVDISYGSIYPTLAKLETEGLVISRLEKDPGKPERKIYQITGSGRQVFVDALGETPAPDKFKSEFLLIAMMAETGTPQTVARAINERVAYLEEELEMITNHLSDCNHPGTRWVGEYGMHIKRTDLQFLRQNRDKLMAIAGSNSPLRDAAE